MIFEKILPTSVCLILSLLSLSAQDSSSTHKLQKSTPTDRNINALNILREDKNTRVVLPQKLQPYISKVPQNGKDSLESSQSNISKTINYLNEGKIAKALFSIYEAISFCPTNEARTYAIANSYYAIIQIKTGNYTKAVTSLNMCDSLFRKIGDLNLLAFHYNNLGLFHQKFERKKLATQYFEKSLYLNRSLGDDMSIAINLNNLSKDQGETDTKISYLNEAIEINKRLKREYSLAENFNNLAFQYKTLHKYNEALKYLDLSFKISEKLESYEILSYNYQLKSEIYASMNRYEDAYNSVLKMHEVNNKLQQFQNLADIEQLIVNRVISKNKYELSLQKKESDIKWLYILLISASTLLVVSILLIIYIYFYINSKRKLQLLQTRHESSEKEIEYAQNELVNLSTYLSSRNAILSNIQSSLSKACKSSEKDIYTDVRKLNMYIKNLQTKNEDVESVLNKIAKINEGFIARLSERHPDITKNDKNIALLLRANLTTKQIATLMDCSPKSINMARYRIRIHLNLTANINLVSYLKTL